MSIKHATEANDCYFNPPIKRSASTEALAAAVFKKHTALLEAQETTTCRVLSADIITDYRAPALFTSTPSAPPLDAPQPQETPALPRLAALTTESAAPAAKAQGPSWNLLSYLSFIPGLRRRAPEAQPAPTTAAPAEPSPAPESLYPKLSPLTTPPPAASAAANALHPPLPPLPPFANDDVSDLHPPLQPLPSLPDDDVSDPAHVSNYAAHTTHIAYPWDDQLLYGAYKSTTTK